MNFSVHDYTVKESGERAVIDGAQLRRSFRSTGVVYPTGIERLDDVLEGGIRSGHVTELTGATCSGKTQTCLRICAHVAGKLGYGVVYVDTTGSFSSSRILQLMTDAGCDQRRSREALARIHRVLCADVRDALAAARRALELKVALLIVDSVTTVGTLALNSPNKVEGLGLLGRLGNGLKTFAADRGRAVVVTNGWVRRREGPGTFGPALGRSWVRVAAVRVRLCGRTAQILKTNRANYGRSCALGR